MRWGVRTLIAVPIGMVVGTSAGLYVGGGDKFTAHIAAVFASALTVIVVDALLVMMFGRG